MTPTASGAQLELDGTFVASTPAFRLRLRATSGFEGTAIQVESAWGWLSPGEQFIWDARMIGEELRSEPVPTASQSWGSLKARSRR